MEKKSLLFYAICLHFALAATALEDTMYDDIEKRIEAVPVGDYPLNGDYGASAVNGIGRNGKMEAVTPTTGPFGEPNGALQFSGKNDSYIEFPNDGSLDTRYSITLMCWVEPGGKDGPLFNYRKRGKWGVHIWIVNGRFFNRITKRRDHDFFPYITTDEPLPVGEWAHVAATYDYNSGNNSIYINGVLNKRQNIGPNEEISTNDPQVRMGVKEGDGRYFKGKITQMKVYNVALNGEEISAVMNEGAPNPCGSQPCNNGGTCINQGYHSFQCICPKGFGGIVCAEELDPCENNPCKNGGTCTDIGDYNFECKCAKGFGGDDCAEELDPCDNNPCKNGGTCTTDIGDYSIECKCAKGFGGDHCAEELDPCENNPCLNGGTCTDIGDYNFECKCAKGFTGRRCHDDVDECEHYNGGCQDLCINTIGGYYCACSDPEFSVAPDHRHCIAEGVELDCGKDEMTIILPKGLLLGLDAPHLRLIDVHCTAKENKTHFFFKTSTTKCGTILKHKNDHAIYSNMVSEIPIKENQIVTRVRQAMIPFHCYYSKWGVVSSIGIKPASKKVILPARLSTNGYGKFTITLDLFKNEHYIAPFSQDDFPVEVYIRRRLFFELRVDTEDKRLTIFALDCYATPSQDRNSEPRYDIIKDGCSVDDDDTLKFHDSVDAQSQRFSLEGFKYVSNNPYVFIHCRAQVCNASDSNSRCAQGCKRRGRRSVKPLPESSDGVYSLAQGPFTMNREKREAEVNDAVNSNPSMRVPKKGLNTPVVATLAVVIGVCAVGMGYMAWQKKKEKTARQFIPLYEDLQ